MPKRRRLNVAVTGLNAIDNPGPGVPLIRALRESSVFDLRIIGLAYESLEPGIYMRDLVDKTYQIPYPSAGIDSLKTRLEYIHSREKLALIIPNFDAELYSFIRLEPALKAMGIATFLPTLDQFEQRQKANLTEFGRRHDILVPQCRSLNDLHEVQDLGKEFHYPVVVKGKYYDAYVAHTPELARAYFSRISLRWGLPVLIQEFIPGHEYNLIGLGDGRGNLVAAVPMRKQYVTALGKAWAGISIEDPELMAIARRFTTATQWRGGFELEMMKTPEDEYYLLEINPRLPAWLYLAVGAGQNIPEALVKLALGQKVLPMTTYSVGKMFVRYSFDLIVDLDQFERITTTGEL